ncbi:tyrosine-protein phosphatase Lar-like [Oscarella lobularis]|uniref:tyrosine-protein phosphatase Lar-like n=1 Tax=Oscarella lobularis TaxID=121494 RepID=UPI003313656E
MVRSFRLLVCSIFLLSYGVLSSSEVPTPRVEAFANETSATLVFFDATPSPSSYEAILSSPRDVVEIRIVHVTRLPTGSPLTSTFTHLSSSTVYTVVVTANYGARRTSNPLVVFVTTLDPLTRPNRPIHVKARNVRGRGDAAAATRLVWSPPSPSRPKGGDRLTRYEIVVRDRRTRRLVVDAAFVDADAPTAFVVGNLSHHARYAARVRAHNRMGAGKWSERVTFMTEEGVPGAPRNFTVSYDEGNSGAKFFWSPPRESNGVLESYTWDCVPVNSSTAFRHPSNRSVAATTRSLHVDGFEVGTLYEVYLWAKNRRWDGTKSELSFRILPMPPKSEEATMIATPTRSSTHVIFISEDTSDGLSERRLVTVYVAVSVIALVTLVLALTAVIYKKSRKSAVHSRETSTVSIFHGEDKS